MGEDPQAEEIEELLPGEEAHLMKGRAVVSRQRHESKSWIV